MAPKEKQLGYQVTSVTGKYKRECIMFVNKRLQRCATGTWAAIGSGVKFFASAAAHSRKTFRYSFPLPSLGSSCTNRTPPRSRLCLATCSSTHFRTTSSVCCCSAPSLTTTYARGYSCSCLVVLSARLWDLRQMVYLIAALTHHLIAATPTSSTRGCFEIRDSNSAGDTCKPLTFMSSWSS